MWILLKNKINCVPSIVGKKKFLITENNWMTDKPLYLIASALFFIKCPEEL